MEGLGKRSSVYSHWWPFSFISSFLFIILDLQKYFRNNCEFDRWIRRGFFFLSIRDYGRGGAKIIIWPRDLNSLNPATLLSRDKNWGNKTTSCLKILSLNNFWRLFANVCYFLLFLRVMKSNTHQQLKVNIAICCVCTRAPMHPGTVLVRKRFWDSQKQKKVISCLPLKF